MKNDSAPPPSSVPMECAEEAGPGDADATSGDGDQRPFAAGQRRSFTRAMAHDLRNTVAPIRNAVQLLRLRDKADPNLAPITDIIDRQVTEIVRLLDVLADADRPPAHSDLRSAADANDRGSLSSADRVTGKHILIVDDNAALLTSLSGVLREAGHEVKTADDGPEALALAQSWKPEFVLLDAHMPRMNGFEVAKQLRTWFPRRVMKLVLMSGSTFDETALRGAERAGFDHCIDKVHDLASLEKLLCNDA